MEKAISANSGAGFKTAIARWAMSGGVQSSHHTQSHTKSRTPSHTYTHSTSSYQVRCALSSRANLRGVLSVNGDRAGTTKGVRVGQLIVRTTNTNTTSLANPSSLFCSPHSTKTTMPPPRRLTSSLSARATSENVILACLVPSSSAKHQDGRG